MLLKPQPPMLSWLKYSMLHRVDFDEPYHTEMVYRQHQVLEALHNAGINVTEAGKGEAS